MAFLAAERAAALGRLACHANAWRARYPEADIINRFTTVRYDLPTRTCREDRAWANERIHLPGIGSRRMDNTSLLFCNASGPSDEKIARGGARNSAAAKATNMSST